MQRRLGREDFDRTSKLMGGRGPGSYFWAVCQEGYDLKELPSDSEEDDSLYQLVPKCPFDPHEGRWRIYEPLNDTPDLFLRFARLYDEGGSIEAIVDWVYRYGVLADDPEDFDYAAPQRLSSFRQKSGEAAGLLALYEAVLSGDSDRVKSVILNEYPVVDEAKRFYARLGLSHERVNRKILDSVEEIYGGDFLLFALEKVVEEVSHMVGRSCHPFLSIEEGSHDPTKVWDRWSFSDLLGAMYLQMYWLIAAGGNVTRCDYCGRIISLGRPGPGSRKPPQHKRFCDKACRQSFHYHNRVKPRRQGDRS